MGLNIWHASLLTVVALIAPSLQQVTYNVKPFLIHPGTRWCGTGARAGSYSDLGSSFESDQCCREHDHCQFVIPPLVTRYGYTSLFHFTLSHCECDVKFYFCLKDSNDAESQSVLEWYFDLVRLPCFELIAKPVCRAFAGGECVRNGTETLAEMRRLPFFSNDVERLRRKLANSR